MKVQLDVPIKYTLLKHEEEKKKWLGAVSVPIQKIHSKDRFSNIRELAKVAKEWKHEEEEKRRKKAGKIEKQLELDKKFREFREFQRNGKDNGSLKNRWHEGENKAYENVIELVNRGAFPKRILDNLEKKRRERGLSVY